MKHPPPHVAAAVRPPRFARLVLEALAAGQESPADLPGGSVRLARGPHERALFALRARLPDEAEYRAVSRRFLALMRLLEDDTLLPLAHGRGGSTLLHPALLDTAARMALARNGNFPPRRFREVAERGAREDYPDLDWPPPTDTRESDS